MKPEIFVTVWVCPKCGWKRLTLKTRKCGRCGKPLVQKLVKVKK